MRGRLSYLINCDVVKQNVVFYVISKASDTIVSNIVRNGSRFSRKK